MKKILITYTTKRLEKFLEIIEMTINLIKITDFNDEGEIFLCCSGSNWLNLKSQGRDDLCTPYEVNGILDDEWEKFINHFKPTKDYLPEMYNNQHFYDGYCWWGYHKDLNVEIPAKWDTNVLKKLKIEFLEHVKTVVTKHLEDERG